MKSEPGPQRDQVGVFDGCQSFRERLTAPWLQSNAANARAAFSDFGLPFDNRPVFQLSLQHHVGVGRRIDSAQAGENLRGNLHGLYEIARQIGEGRKEKVAEAVTLQSAAFGEPVLEQLREQGLVFRESHHAVTDIARWQNIEFASQAPGTAPVVGNGDDGGDLNLARFQGIALQTMQKRGKPGTPSNGDDAKRRHYSFGASLIRLVKYRIAGSGRGFADCRH